MESILMMLPPNTFDEANKVYRKAIKCEDAYIITKAIDNLAIFLTTCIINNKVKSKAFKITLQMYQELKEKEKLLGMGDKIING